MIIWRRCIISGYVEEGRLGSLPIEVKVYVVSSDIRCKKVYIYHIIIHHLLPPSKDRQEVHRPSLSLALPLALLAATAPSSFSPLSLSISCFRIFFLLPKPPRPVMASWIVKAGLKAFRAKQATMTMTPSNPTNNHW